MVGIQLSRVENNRCREPGLVCFGALCGSPRPAGRSPTSCAPGRSRPPRLDAAMERALLPLSPHGLIRRFKPWFVSVRAVRSPAWNRICRRARGSTLPQTGLRAVRRNLQGLRRLPGGEARYIRSRSGERQRHLVGQPHSQAHANDQHLRDFARQRPSAGEDDVPGHGPLRFAQQQRDGCARRGSGSQRRCLRCSRIAGMRAVFE